MPESSISMARRHVAEGERRIASQIVTIEALHAIGASVWLAEQLLLEMEISQSLFLSDLSRLEQIERR